MAVTYNIKGTTNSSFKIGKTGTGTVYLNTLSADDLSATGNLTVSGNLIVQGTTTTVSSATIEVKEKFVFDVKMSKKLWKYKSPTWLIKSKFKKIKREIAPMIGPIQ